MKIHVYQHTGGDLDVCWTNDGRKWAEQSFEFDVGGAIGFALGLKAGVIARREAVELSTHFQDPLLNRGFLEGYKRGLIPLSNEPVELGNFVSRESAPSGSVSPGEIAKACAVLHETLR